jgi:hypothetical protein
MPGDISRETKQYRKKCWKLKHIPKARLSTANKRQAASFGRDTDKDEPPARGDVAFHIRTPLLRQAGHGKRHNYSSSNHACCESRRISAISSLVSPRERRNA